MSLVLLLHPLGSHGGFWTSSRSLLGRASSAPDLLGHGRAPVLEHARLEDYADAVAMPAPAVVVGISLGGLVAQALAARQPERVLALVLVDSVAVYPAPFRDTWPQRAATARAEGLLPLADAMESVWFGDAFRADHPEVVAEARRAFLATDPEGYATTCDLLHEVDLSAGLPHIAVPTLVVCGTADAPAFVEAAPALVDAIPDAELTWLTGARHASVLEQPEEFAAAVRRFVDYRGL